MATSYEQVGREELQVRSWRGRGRARVVKRKDLCTNNFDTV